MRLGAITTRGLTTCIRVAGPRDGAAILRLVRDLVVRSRYTQGGLLDAEHLARHLDRLLDHPDTGFLVAGDGPSLSGLLVLIVTEDLLSAERIAAEVCWWVDPAHRDGLGLRLLEAGEAWARAQGASRLHMLAPEGKFESVFRRRGYAARSRIYERRL